MFNERFFRLAEKANPEMLPSSRQTFQKQHLGAKIGVCLQPRKTLQHLNVEIKVSPKVREEYSLSWPES